MNVNDKNLCPSCFAELEDDKCKACGYTNESVGHYPNALPIGTILMGRYLIGKVLGKGGFGVTYLTYDLNQQRKVAIKEYLPDTLAHRNTGKTEVSTYTGEKGDAFRLGAEKFYEEAKTVSRFNGHPNIINVYEFFYDNNTAYFVMEYLSGIDLKTYVANNGGRIAEERVKEIVLPVIDALTVIHSVGILHRDISPDNIYICDDGNVKLLDFGAARQVLGEQSKSLSVVLKQGFAPIEQYQTRGRQGEWTDIYALGATMYYCLTGKVPESAMDRVYEDNIKTFSELGIDVSDKLSRIIMRSIAVREITRYQSMFDMKAAFVGDKLEETGRTDENITDRGKADFAEAAGVKPGAGVIFRKRKAIVYAAIACLALLISISAFAALNRDSKKNTDTGGGGGAVAAGLSSSEKVGELSEEEVDNDLSTLPSASGNFLEADTLNNEEESPFDEPEQSERTEETSAVKPSASAAAGITPAAGTRKPSASVKPSAKPSSTTKAEETYYSNEPEAPVVSQKPAVSEKPTVTASPYKSSGTSSKSTVTVSPTPVKSPSSSVTSRSSSVSVTTKVTGVAYTYKTAKFSVKCKYTGDWKDNKPNGYGELQMIENVSPYWQSGDKLRGAFVNGLLNGVGKYTGISGGSYNGSFKNGLKEGYGVFVYSDGSKYEGYFKNGTYDGYGVYTDSSGHVWKGNWVEGSFKG